MACNGPMIALSNPQETSNRDLSYMEKNDIDGGATKETTMTTTSSISTVAAPKGIMRKRSNPNVTKNANSRQDESSGYGSSSGNELSEDFTGTSNRSGGVSGSGNTSDHATSKGSNMLFTSTNQVFNFLKVETISVLYSQRLVYVVILIAAAVLSTLTYLVISNDQDEDFQIQYQTLCNQFTTLIHDEAEQVLDSFAIQSRAITSAALDENATWPFFQLAYYERKAKINAKMTKSFAQLFAPLVKLEERAAWEQYVLSNHDWVNESIAVSGEAFDNVFVTAYDLPLHPLSYPYVLPYIQRHENYSIGPLVNQTNTTGLDFGISYTYLPIWQHSPFQRGLVNRDIASVGIVYRAFKAAWENNETMFSEIIFPLFNYEDEQLPVHDDDPYANVIQPVYSKFPSNATTKPNREDMVAITSSLMSWKVFFTDILASKSLKGLVLVLADQVNRNLTFHFDEYKTTYVGYGDFHESKYDHMVVSSTLVYRQTEHPSQYNYKFYLYPSSEMEAQYQNNEPLWYALGIVAIFLFAALNFTIYNYFVHNRQNKVMAALTATSKVIASIFPANVLDRLLKEAEEEAKRESILSGQKLSLARTTQKSKLRTFLDDVHHNNDVDVKKSGEDAHIIFKTRPIADLYTCATIMYADIVGFTAWSSIREPTQVFTLLETVFRQYDEIAKRRRVFKVETIGDCYVSVCGVPDPRPDHAVVMARYGFDCLQALYDLSDKLAVELGPDTSELGMRIGMHSGPVTAGILRGEKSRFQLFGDSVHMCALMEKTSARNRIQVSQRTADLLAEAGKSSWLEKRADNSDVDFETYWLSTKGSKGSKSSGSDGGSDSCLKKMDYLDSTHAGNDDEGKIVEVPAIVPKPISAKTNNIKDDNYSTSVDIKIKRLVDWNAELLIRLLKQVIAHRNVAEYKQSKTITDNLFRRTSYESSSLTGIDWDTSSHEFTLNTGTVIDEVVEIIDMPEFNSRMKHDQVDASSIELLPAVCEEIKAFIGMIAALYRDNPFHNFEHASHVTMSVSKLLSRIVAPDLILNETETEDATESAGGNVHSTLHDHTYGITSDPMTQFACVFSALIHDVDHPGVPNAQLVKERDLLARLYNDQSVAEQNSIDIAWRMFMDDNNTNFRTALCPRSNDIVHFRQLVVNSVMATDIVDKKLKELRNKRWDVAFQVCSTNKESVRDQINRKATIVIEHLIQASDVSHTMQHWHVYCRWNEMFYHEMYKAYREGRAEKDPSEFWYKGEIGFYDFYIIPLAKKLKDCGVFGVSSDEYLNYAMKNRAEWEIRGEEVVSKMVEHYRKMYEGNE